MVSEGDHGAWDVALAAAIDEYVRRHPRCGEAMERMAESMPGGDTRSSTWFSPFPIVIDSGNGAEMRDLDGNVLLDLICNYTSLVHGHCPSFITTIVREQTERGYVFAAPMLEQGELAAEITSRIPSADLVRFTNSGTEAGMLAARLARAWTGRRRLAVALHSYHGSFEDLDWRARESTGTAVFPVNDEAGTRAALDAAGPLAAVFIEPVLGSGGIIAADMEYLTFLREYTRETGAALVMDEVMTLRLGYGGRQETVGVTPDLTVLGKIIGGGFAVGAVAGSEDIMRLTDPSRRGHLGHGGSFNGHRVTMAAGSAALRRLDRPAIQRLNALGDRLAGDIGRVCRESGLPVCITSCGSMLNLHAARKVTNPTEASDAARTTLARYLHVALLNHGVYVAMRGEMCLCTPVTDAMASRVVAAVDEVLTEARAFAC